MIYVAQILLAIWLTAVLAGLDWLGRTAIHRWIPRAAARITSR